MHGQLIIAPAGKAMDKYCDEDNSFYYHDINKLLDTIVCHTKHKTLICREIKKQDSDNHINLLLHSGIDIDFVIIAPPDLTCCTCWYAFSMHCTS